MSRPDTNRIGVSARSATGLTARTQTARTYGATGRSSGRSNWATSQARVLRRRSALWARRNTKMIARISATPVPNANRPRDTHSVSRSNERQNT